MLESIIIRNFGPINEIEINDIRPFTVFIGESGSGKSTIIKVVALFRWIFKMVSIRSYLKQSGITSSPFTFDFKEYLKNDGIGDYLTPTTEIIYRNGDCSIKYNPKTGLKTTDIKDRTQLSIEKISFISDKRNIIPDILANKVNLGESAFYIKETLNDYLLAAKEIRELSIDYLGVKLIVKKTSAGEKFFIQNIVNDENYEINLEDASSGTQNVSPLSLIIEYFSKNYNLTKSFNNSLLSYLVHSDNLSKFDAVTDVGGIKNRRVNIHIEEPELSLYPESQRNLINFLIRKCFAQSHDGYDMTLMLTTHSPYILNHVNLLIKAGEKGKFEEGAQLLYENVDLYEVSNGSLNNLKLKNSKIIDTRSLSIPISDIYARYNELDKL